MIQEIINYPAMTLYGVTTRTTNAEEMSPHGRLPGLWQTFFQSNLAAQMDIRNPRRTYALYTRYESDHKGAYTVLIGHEPTKEQSERSILLEQAKVPASTYRVFTCPPGPVSEVVARTWGEIWSYYEHSSEQRAYTGDFEIYEANDENQTEIKIYIAIK
ncbi:putative transcriptional regulator YdeE [Paenibacillus shirakamiensis]|uniref:Transcriptional regulator YdeE n=1 Tax=Paenibacillus shirakamiensis TaxID=1265935 RepID=A0ABS4JJX6_9BACL|nr:effector binding domain-containing protein [Paenibacillus shirakamiensis]MBP2002013.1 putative transcriptional regulator YdeE [Paenibacillus shirakamiensis]